MIETLKRLGNGLDNLRANAHDAYDRAYIKKMVEDVDGLIEQATNGGQEAFEKRFPVPEGVHYNHGMGRYEPDSAFDPDATHAAFLHHQRWVGWREALKGIK